MTLPFFEPFLRLRIFFQEDKLKTVFSEPKAQIVEKNNNGYLALIGDKLYLYELF